MKKVRFISLTLVVLMLVSMMSIGTPVSAAKEVELPFDGVAEPTPKGNLITDGAFDDPSCVTNWNANWQKITQVDSANGGYLQMSKFLASYYGFQYTFQGKGIDPGKYKFTGYFRMLYPGELTELRFEIYGEGTNHLTAKVYPTHDAWLKVEFYFETDYGITAFKTAGGPYMDFIQHYALDNFSIVAVDSFPSGAIVLDQYQPYETTHNFGTPITPEQATASNNGSASVNPLWDPEVEAKWEVGGIMLNRDRDWWYGRPQGATEDELRKFVYGYKDSHVTDYLIDIFCTESNTPSEVATDMVDLYYENIKNFEPVTDNQRAAYNQFELDNIDYVKVFCETFAEIGINPWLSYRMNDAHTQGLQGSRDLQQQYPDQLVRVKRADLNIGMGSYYNHLLDYSYFEVRDFFLRYINESLSRYDVYGIELDWQRDIYLWYIGGEYNGLDILNDFMRDVNDIVKIYEEKYGHEIKVCVRVASTVQQNYDLGLDVLTWAAEGLVDVVNPTTRWATTNFNIPVRAWCSLLHPHGVEVAPGFESRIQTNSGSTTGVTTLETIGAFAISAFSQGADKVYAYNWFRDFDNLRFYEYTSKRVSTSNLNLYRTSEEGYWNMLSTAGSLQKLLTVDHRMIMTYDDVIPAWETYASYCDFPKTAQPGETLTFRIPLGEVSADAKVVVKFAANNLNIKNLPESVLINGAEATYVGLENCADNYTVKRLLCYEVPESALDDMFLVVEITPVKFLNVDHAELYVYANGEQ